MSPAIVPTRTGGCIIDCMSSRKWGRYSGWNQQKKQERSSLNKTTLSLSRENLYNKRCVGSEKAQDTKGE